MKKTNWVNGQAGGTPLSAENLNKMEDNIEEAIDEVLEKIGEWNFAGQVVGYNGVSLSNIDYGTLLIVVLAQHPSGYPFCTTVEIPKVALSDTEYRFFDMGAYGAGNETYFRVGAISSEVGLNGAYLNKSNMLSSTITKVFYK